RTTRPMRIRRCGWRDATGGMYRTPGALRHCGDIGHPAPMPPPKRSIHVVAGVITDARGRILLNRRTENRDMAGLWEFPGGKRESGESSEQALARELHEELGIEAEIGDWLMDVPQLYPDKHLTLEVRHIRRWKGTPRG